MPFTVTGNAKNTSPTRCSVFGWPNSAHAIPTTSAAAGLPKPISTKFIHYGQPQRLLRTRADASNDAYDADADANEYAHESAVRFASAGASYASERHAPS
jgi:hypothetical protein